MIGRTFVALVASGLISGAACAADSTTEMRFEISLLPALQRYADLLVRPSYAAVVLASNGLSPSPSGRLVLKERGRAVELRHAEIRFENRDGAHYRYEVGMLGLGSGELRPRMVVTLDTSAIGQGRISLVLKPPLAAMPPTSMKEAIQSRVQALASKTAQQNVAAYLETIAPENLAGSAPLIEAILADAYNRSAAPGQAERDIGEAISLADQWRLLLTMAVWLVALQIVLVLRLVR